MVNKYTILKKILKLSLASIIPFGANAQVGELIWSDEFTSLNTEVWNPITGNGCEIGLCGWGNAELEYYHPDNLTIEPIDGEDGNYAIVFTAREETIGTNSFTSGKIDSEGKLSVQYGMIEIRMKTPDLDTGLWPAAWLLGTTNLGWPAKGEIDMMEMGHGEDDRAFQGHPNVDINSYVGSNVISANEDGNAGSIAHDANYNKPYVAPTPMNDRYVIYRLYWDSGQIRFTVVDNGVEHDLYEEPLGISEDDDFTAPFTKPFFFLMNLAVGGNFTDAAIPGQVTATLPAKMYVDYLRIYEWNGQGNVAFNYDELQAESGVYGVYTENANVNEQLTFGNDAEIYLWNNLETTDGVEPSEGSEVLSWQTLTPGQWFGAGITTLYGKDMSNYVENGYLKFDIKIPADVSFKVIITDNYTNQSELVFPAGQTTYGLVRDGEWGTAEIPLIDFAGSIAFQDIENMFSIASVDGQIPTETFEFAIDNIYWTENSNQTLSNNTFENYSESEGSIYPMPAVDFVNIEIPNAEKFTVVQIIDLAGKVVKNESTIGRKVFTMDVQDLQSGFYMVKLFNNNRSIKLRKLVKQ